VAECLPEAGGGGKSFFQTRFVFVLFFVVVLELGNTFENEDDDEDEDKSPKTISPCSTLRSSRDKLGDGSAPRSLSHAGIWRSRLSGAASFPTPFSTASGVSGLVAGPSCALRSQDYRVRLFSSLGLVVAPPACEPGQDTSVTAFSRLHHLAPGRPPLLAVRWPGATGLAS